MAPGLVPGATEIVFELLSVAVVHQVNARINPLVFHLGIVRHIRSPFRGVVANKVVALAGQFLDADDGRR